MHETSPGVPLGSLQNLFISKPVMAVEADEAEAGREHEKNLNQLGAGPAFMRADGQGTVHIALIDKVLLHTAVIDQESRS
jgi:hypothetical protein